MYLVKFCSILLYHVFVDQSQFFFCLPSSVSANIAFYFLCVSDGFVFCGYVLEDMSIEPGLRSSPLTNRSAADRSNVFFFSFFFSVGLR